MGTATYVLGLATVTVAFPFCSVKQKRRRILPEIAEWLTAAAHEDARQADLPRRALMPEPRSGEDAFAMTAQSALEDAHHERRASLEVHRIAVPPSSSAWVAV